MGFEMIQQKLKSISHKTHPRAAEALAAALSAKELLMAGAAGEDSENVGRTN